VSAPHTDPHVDAPHEGWTPLPPREALGLAPSFVSGDPQGQRLRVAYFVRDEDAHVVGRVWFGPLAEGPPGHAHGGSIAAVLDELMGSAAWLAGHRVVAVKLDVEFKKAIRLGTTATFAARVTSSEGRKIVVTSEMFLPDGALAATGHGTFLVIDMERLLKGELSKG
jgi:acyl-coenzyme A thioesterase PaaI-like protein